MKNTNQKNPPSAFEIHTMQSDNATRSTQPQTPIGETLKPNELLSKTTATPSSEPNPFLSDTPLTEADGIGKKTFAPMTQDGPEKIHYDISDISDTITAPQETASPGASSAAKKILLVVVGVLFITLIAGGVYYFFFMRQPAAEPQAPEQTPVTPSMPSTTTTEDPAKTVTYFLDMPNYFTIDLNNPSVFNDITSRIAEIRTNLPQQSPTKPVTFIVTDTSSSPISFHQFALAAKIALTEDILSVLNKDFELHAYNDPEAGGIRFGIVVNAKDPVALQSALRTHEQMLPQAFAPFITAEMLTAYPITFADNVYYSKPLRYANLNTEETYSIDYAVFNNQWLVGTSKNTLRAMFDALHEKTLYQEPSQDFAY